MSTTATSSSALAAFFAGAFLAGARFFTSFVSVAIEILGDNKTLQAFLLRAVLRKHVLHGVNQHFRRLLLHELGDRRALQTTRAVRGAKMDFLFHLLAREHQLVDVRHL